MNRGRKTNEEWTRLHREAVEYVSAGSGSVGAFCREQGVSVDSFYSACTRLGLKWPTLRERKQKKAKTTTKFQKFVPVGGMTNGHSKTRMELSYGDVKISLESGDVDGLRCVLETLKHQGAN